MSLEQRLRSEVTHKNVKKEVTVDDEVKELDFEELVDRQAKGEKYVFQNTAADWLHQDDKLRLRNISRNIFGNFIGIFEQNVFEFSQFDVSVCDDQVLVLVYIFDCIDHNDMELDRVWSWCGMNHHTV